ncbi:MAG: response regulator [Pirellulaceae bacterium]
MLKKRILVVDDHPDICASMKDILDDAGFDVNVALDPQEALRQVAEQSFDLVLLDYQMPGMNGAALFKKIRQIRPDMQAIMITAYAGQSGAQEILGHGARKVLSKPLDVQGLLNEMAFACPL